MKKVGIIQYPCSNGDMDMFNYFENSFFIWHKETNLQLLDNIDLLVLPGGFAFGDRYYEKATQSSYTIRPGKMAVESPCREIIMEAHKRGIPILGVCNGFQILIELGLLPGQLVQNDEKQFVHDKKTCTVYGQTMQLLVANQYGKYIPPLDNNFEIFMTCDENIVGVKNRNIYGIMPHPERTKNELFKKLLAMDIAIENVMLSEHITYKSSKKYLKNLPISVGNRVVVPPGENSGIVDIGNGYGLVMKIESHNHPLMVDAYEASATGVGGAIRDIFTMGGRPIGLLDFLRFDSKENPLVAATIKGIADYGNCVGIPNIGGDFLLNTCYKNNPLINVCCLGLVKLDQIIYGRVSEPDDLIIYVGNTTGSDGIGGTCMASKPLGDTQETNQEENNYSVQKSDPYLEKLLLEACCECADQQLITGMQDMGAGGLLCSLVELVQRGRDYHKKSFGCDLFLEEIPIRNQNMLVEDILTSESQERMLMVCKERNYPKIQEIFRKWDLECHYIGNVTDNNQFRIYKHDECVYERDVKYFTTCNIDWELKDYNKNFHTDTRVKDRNLWKQYDSTIGCRTINGPLDSGDFSILDIPEIKGQLMVTWGASIFECYDKMKSHATPLCVVNCLNFGDPKDIIQEFKECVEKMTYEAKQLDIPIIGGNVSLYNATNGDNIKGTPVIVMCGIINF